MTIRNCDRHSSASDGPRVPGKPKLGRQCEVFLCSYFVLIEYLRGLSTNHDMPPKSSTHPVDSNSPPMLRCKYLTRKNDAFTSHR